jgi:pimeloyl-ACP methyl ester carboxylesterase
VTSELMRRAVSAAVILPGTGSDEVFVQAAFGRAVSAAGLLLVAPEPRHGATLAEHFLSSLDSAADRYGPIVVGGISLGAHLAAEWASANPSRCAGLLAAMPGWYGSPADEEPPGSVTARVSSEAVAKHGIDTALADATREAPGWLAEELNRAWRRAGADLVESLRVAVSRPAPTLDVLSGITVPACVVGCVDDPVHPLEVARRWATALPRAELRTITFAELGADRSSLGRAALVGLPWIQEHVGHGDPDDDGRGRTAEQQR